MSDDSADPLQTLNYDEETEAYHARYDERRCSPSEAVTRVIAGITDTDARELDPLYDSLDSEALDLLLSHNNQASDKQVVFTYHGYQVSVESDGKITVTPLEATDD